MREIESKKHYREEGTREHEKECTNSRERRASHLSMQLAYMGSSLRLSGRMSWPAGDWLEQCLR